jgi:hypothetical protein
MLTLCGSVLRPQLAAPLWWREVIVNPISVTFPDPRPGTPPSQAT